MCFAKGGAHGNFIEMFVRARVAVFSHASASVRLRTPLCGPEQPMRNPRIARMRLSFRKSFRIALIQMTIRKRDC